ncbi:MAG TPA: hypothetical protein VGC95_08630 [Chitinophagaceae bacterium]|jgi:hypothetical protein
MEQELEKIFDISFTDNGREYSGWVNPSAETNEAGLPASYHVVLDNVSFGYVSFKDCRWMVSEERPAGLTAAVGHAIEQHYQL